MRGRTRESSALQVLHNLWFNSTQSRRAGAQSQATPLVACHVPSFPSCSRNLAFGRDSIQDRFGLRDRGPSHASVHEHAGLPLLSPLRSTNREQDLARLAESNPFHFERVSAFSLPSSWRTGARWKGAQGTQALVIVNALPDDTILG